MNTNKSKLLNSLKAEETKVVQSQPRTYNEDRFELADKITISNNQHNNTINQVNKSARPGKRTSIYISAPAVDKLNLIENSIFDLRIKASLSELVSLAIEQLALLDKAELNNLLTSHGCKTIEQLQVE